LTKKRKKKGRKDRYIKKQKGGGRFPLSFSLSPEIYRDKFKARR